MKLGSIKKEVLTIDINSINKLFSPEFRNRLDAIINFNRLEKNIVNKITNKFIMQLETQLNPRI